MKDNEHRPLEAKEVVIQVPKGTADNVRIVETDSTLGSEITVRVSKKRVASKMAVVGVIVK
ncbi:MULTISPECIES: hypothetical protein [unclassified Pseudomonas]|uniref:hypothetical protein n=1 Tax=unclassified Pseudomonas TaxID=196821 RepID=UPI00215F032A|nr:hypothetical protein [Pseudomonas sp. B21-015]UVM51200.1 hypothetical protein LOY38_03765 [Pseudomonas sp. B21-015]